MGGTIQLSCPCPITTVPSHQASSQAAGEQSGWEMYGWVSCRPAMLPPVGGGLEKLGREGAAGWRLCDWRGQCRTGEERGL